MIFSVIVPFLNEERYIEQCVSSLLNQDFDKNEYELIFVDNGSADKSTDIVRKFPSVTILREYKRYEYACFNAGLKFAKGEIVAFTNADCLMPSDWLSQIYHGVRLSNADVVLGRRYFPSSKSFLMQMIEEYENVKVEYVLKNCTSRKFFGYTNNMAIKANIFKKIGLFCEAHRGGDTEFIQRLVSRIPSARVGFLPGAKVIHMEMESVKTWLKKNIGYAYANRIVMKSSSCKPIGHYPNLCSFRYTINRGNYKLCQKFMFFLLLITCKIFYQTGWIIGYINDEITQNRS